MWSDAGSIQTGSQTLSQTNERLCMCVSDLCATRARSLFISSAVIGCVVPCVTLVDAAAGEPPTVRRPGERREFDASSGARLEGVRTLISTTVCVRSCVDSRVVSECVECDSVPFPFNFVCCSWSHPTHTDTQRAPTALTYDHHRRRPKSTPNTQHENGTRKQQNGRV